MPVTVLQQDWGAFLGFDAQTLWSAWAPELASTTVNCGHFMAEEAPEQITVELRKLLARKARVSTAAVGKNTASVSMTSTVTGYSRQRRRRTET